MSEDAASRRAERTGQRAIDQERRSSGELDRRPIRPHPNVITITCNHQRSKLDRVRSKLNEPTNIVAYNRNVHDDGTVSWTLTTVDDPRLAAARLNMHRAVRHDYVLNGEVYDESILDRGMPLAGPNQIDLTGLQVRTVFTCRPCEYERALQEETLYVVLNLVYESGESSVTLAGVSRILQELARQRKRSGRP